MALTKWKEGKEWRETGNRERGAREAREIRGQRDRGGARSLL